MSKYIFFRPTGPSFVYAGDVLGTLAAFAAGYENIAKGYVDAAIVGVCSNFLEPVMSLNFMNMNFLSADSYSRVFSSDGIELHIYKCNLNNDFK